MAVLRSLACPFGEVKEQRSPLVIAERLQPGGQTAPATADTWVKPPFKQAGCCAMRFKMSGVDHQRVGAPLSRAVARIRLNTPSQLKRMKRL